MSVGPQKEPPPVLPICGLLYRDEERVQEVFARLEPRLGEPELVGDVIPFDRTDYYEPEMGAGLLRRYVCFRKLMAAEQLPELKRWVWQLEQELASAAGRQVNLDPGYLDYTKVVLASFKQGPQKLYLGLSVWADMVLYFRDGAWGALPWTFPDLRGDEHWPFFKAARLRYKGMLKAQRKERA